MYLKINKLRVTPEHLIYVNDAWNNAEFISKGDLLCKLGGEPEIVTEVTRVNEEVTVYNFHTSHYTHNYFAERILVHNRKGFAEGGIFNKPQLGLFGEAGAEAIVPLEGANKRYGLEILQKILPMFGKDIYKLLPAFQTGGVFDQGFKPSPVTGRYQPPMFKYDKLDQIIRYLDIISHNTSQMISKDDRLIDMISPIEKISYPLNLMKEDVKSFSALKKGAITRGPQLSMIGEKGAEAVIPLEGFNKRKYGEDLFRSIMPIFLPNLPKDIKEFEKRNKGLKGFGKFDITPYWGQDPYKTVTMMQTGGIVGGGKSITYGGDSNYNESYNITGPITVTGVQDVNGFMNQLKRNARVTGSR
jgi:hypothetical protein